MKHVVVGMGEIGRALFAILRTAYGESVHGVDIHPTFIGTADMIHICFPWNNRFADSVREYQIKFRAKYTVIHSTVPVGTSESLGAVHSPVRGQHWNMTESLRTFVKFVGGPIDAASVVANELLRAGIPVHIVNSAAATEFGKIMDTTFYGVMIQYARDIDDYCRTHGLSMTDVFTYWTKTYNEGYERIGHPEYVRPVITAIQLPIGGHCVMPNAKMVPVELERWAKIVGDK